MHRAFFLLVGLATASFACSTDVDDLFGGSANEGGSGAAGGAGPGATSSVTTGPGGPATTGPGGQTSSATTTTTTVATTTSVATTTTGGNLSPTVSCNNAPCNAGEVCCYLIFEAGQDFCSAPGSCPGDDGWIELSCNGPDDCPNQVCCGTFNNQSWVDVSCQDSCNGGNELLMCEGDASVCELNTVCQPSQLLGGGYSYCGNG
jgi:hypothetical protein